MKKSILNKLIPLDSPSIADQQKQSDIFQKTWSSQKEQQWFFFQKKQCLKLLSLRSREELINFCGTLSSNTKTSYQGIIVICLDQKKKDEKNVQKVNKVFFFIQELHDRHSNCGCVYRFLFKLCIWNKIFYLKIKKKHPFFKITQNESPNEIKSLNHLGMLFRYQSIQNSDAIKNQELLTLIIQKHAPGNELFMALGAASICDHMLIIAIQIIESVFSFHHQGIAHGDIKLENMVIDPSCIVRFIDFGFSCAKDDCTGKIAQGTPGFLHYQLGTFAKNYKDQCNNQKRNQGRTTLFEYKKYLDYFAVLIALCELMKIKYLDKNLFELFAPCVSTKNNPIPKILTKIDIELIAEGMQFSPGCAITQKLNAAQQKNILHRLRKILIASWSNTMDAELSQFLVALKRLCHPIPLQITQKNAFDAENQQLVPFYFPHMHLVFFIQQYLRYRASSRFFSYELKVNGESFETHLMKGIDINCSISDIQSSIEYITNQILNNQVVQLSDFKQYKALELTIRFIKNEVVFNNIKTHVDALSRCTWNFFTCGKKKFIQNLWNSTEDMAWKCNILPNSTKQSSGHNMNRKTHV